MSWACVVCHTPRTVADALPPLTETLNPSYRQGKCRKCRQLRFFEPIGESKRDPELGQIGKEKGMGKAERSATPEGWVARFDAALHSLALQRIEFTSEDVTARAGFPAEATHNAVGARMNAAARKGQIVWTGRMRSADRPGRHASLSKIWRGAA